MNMNTNEFLLLHLYHIILKECDRMRTEVKGPGDG